MGLSSRLIYVFLFVSTCFAGTTTVIFNPQSVSAGPFPTNALTQPSWFTPTGLQIYLNAGDENVCVPGGHASVCSNADALNTLDGFSINPRVMACFSGPLDPATIAAGMYLARADAPSVAIGLNQIVYDPVAHCAFGKPDHILDQRTNYLLLLTSELRDQSGKSVKDDGSYRNCLKSSTSYCESLADAVSKLSGSSSDGKITSASLFTTMSTTSWLEDAYLAESFFPSQLLPASAFPTFTLSQVQALTWLPDRASGVTSVSLPLDVLKGVAQVSFGLFLSPNYLNPSGSAAGTITGTPFVPVPVPGVPGIPGFIPVSFHVFVPAGIPPATGWPVVIYGHGLSDNQFGAPTYIASTLAQAGFATVAMEITGHGFGPNSVMQVSAKDGSTYTVQTPGRGILLPSRTTIGAEDGCIVPGALAIRDCGRQTAVDLFALVKTMRDTNGMQLGLDSNSIYYVGQSFGSIYGSLFHAVEPSVRAAVLNGGGGTFTDIARLALTGRPLGQAFLASLGLLSAANCPGNCFNDQYAFRDQPPVIADVPGALAMQAAFEAAEWLGMLGEPLAFAPHFKSSPLAGVPAKKTLFQFGLGDLEVPNPTESALVRAADGLDSTWLLSFDRVVQQFPDLALYPLPSRPDINPFPILPHRILSNPTVGVGGQMEETAISLAQQQQVASFFASGRANIANPNTFLQPPASPAAGFFLQPSVLPQTLNFPPGLP